VRLAASSTSPLRPREARRIETTSVTGAEDPFPQSSSPRPPAVCDAKSPDAYARGTAGRSTSPGAALPAHTLALFEFQGKKATVSPRTAGMFLSGSGPLGSPHHAGWARELWGEGGAVRPPGGLFSGRWSRFLESAAGRRARLARSKRRWRIGISAVGGSNSGGRCPPSM